MSLSQAERRRPTGLWSPGNRNLTVGLVLTITLVAFEALAVATVMPIVEQELGDIELYGWVFTAFMLGSLIGIVVAGGLIDRRGLGGPFVAGIGLFAIGLVIGGLAPVDGRARRRAVHPGPGRRRDPADRLRRHRPAPAGAPAAADVRDAVDGLGHPRASSARPSPGSSARPSAGASSSSACCRSSRVAGAHRLSRRPSGRAADEAAPAEAAAAASTRRRLPLALVVAAGTGLLLAGLTAGEPVLLVGPRRSPAWPSPRRRSRASPRPARCGPRAACPRRCSCAAS